MNEGHGGGSGGVSTIAMVDSRAEAFARLLALEGLGTTDGLPRLPSQGSGWNKEEWERRILEVIPAAAERRCREAAATLLAKLSRL